ncbi:unnamed protein product [Phaedon cochleariae]|uniref:ZP domain-containing protein n=1 Tax=Phaedon cochleariae TaxID=80249 RepID=A0A9P0DTB6_PHACE|nr:unnamed protein product [Phaedon cochleariae]
MSRYLLLAACLSLSAHKAATQSNYAAQANNVEYRGDGLPDQATLDGKVTRLDDLSPVIFLNRTKAALNCAAGSMQIELKFNEKFFGIAYAEFDRNSACRVFGKGGLSYKLELPLKGCGTKQDPQRVFTNNIVVRFHPGLEIDGDEIITIVCRYPPPIVPPPAALPIPLIDSPAAPVAAPIKEFQILLVICGILFLSLLLLGLGCSYYCLRRRPVTFVRQPFSSLGSGSEITKLSGSSLGNLSMFEGLKIPRANVPPVMAAGSSAGSEGPLMSDNLPSDYPSESHSEIDVDTGSLPVSSAGSYENQAYIQDSSSFYSEGYGHTQEQQIQNAMATAATVPRLPLAVKEQPRFDVQVRVKKSPPSPPSISMSDTESTRTDRNLSTIPEQREDSVRSISPSLAERTQFSYIPELHPPPKHIQPAPTYNRILRRQMEMHEEPMRVVPARSIASLNTEMTDTHSLTEMIDDSHHMFIAPTPPPPPPIIPKQEYLRSMEEPDSLEPPISAVHKPEITSHVVDDVFLRTITEKKTIEDIERHRRLVTEYHTRPRPVPDQKWDVTIKNYPVEMPEPPEWENFSDISSASNMTLTPKPERAKLSLPPQTTIVDNKLPLNAPEIVANIGQQPHRYSSSVEVVQDQSYLSTFNIPIENPEVPNWNVLIKVLQPTEQEEGPVIESAETFNAQLTTSDKMKWRQIITTESSLRTLLTECVVREDYERVIHSDSRYATLFEPPKWDVIIRILSPPDKPKSRKKRNDWDNRSRRSSLPTLYEYDSDGESSVRTLTRESFVLPQHSRRTSRSSYRSEADLRSMSEMIVDFGRPDAFSETSSYYPDKRYYADSETGHPSLARSLSQPSLARSASEFTERWVAPSRYDTASEFTSPEGTPKSQRSSRVGPLSLPRSLGEQRAVWQASQVSSGQQGPSSKVTSQVVTQEYRESSTYMGHAPPKGWFADNDSEASFK